MRVMYDALTPHTIPADAQMIAGYIDAGPHPATQPWTDADFAMFPNAVHVRIATQPHTNDGHVLDVESGNATPAQAPSWCLMRRAAGIDPSVYCSEYQWPELKHQFQIQNVRMPHWRIASYSTPPDTSIPAGAVAHQHTSVDAYDISSVADYWPGVDGDNDVTTPTEVDQIVRKALDDKVGAWMQQSEAREDKYIHDLLSQWLPEMEARLVAHIDAKTPSTGLSHDEVVAIVRGELDKTKLGT